MELISRNIFDKAVELGDKHYTELKISAIWNKVDSIIINHANKTYWFTDLEDAKHIIKFFKQ